MKPVEGTCQNCQHWRRYDDPSGRIGWKLCPKAGRMTFTGERCKKHQPFPKKKGKKR